MRKVMVVDDNVTNLNVARKALESNYEIFPILDGKKALKTIEKISPDIILLDVEMPEMDGFEVISKIKAMGFPYSNIPIIFVTAKDDKTSEFDGLNLGAVDYIIKPFAFPLLLKRVEVHLNIALQQRKLQGVNQSLENMYETQNETIQDIRYSIVHVLSDVVENYDENTKDHLHRTSEYLKVLLKKAREMDVYSDQLKNIDIDLLVQISKLHDIGEIALPNNIITNEGEFTNSEFEIMKSHTTEGENIIKTAVETIEKYDYLDSIELISLHPELLKEDIDFSLNSKLMSIVCVYDSLISMKNKKNLYNHEEAVQLITSSSGLHFDKQLIEVFKQVSGEFKDISTKYQQLN